MVLQPVAVVGPVQHFHRHPPELGHGQPVFGFLLAASTLAMAVTRAVNLSQHLSGVETHPGLKLTFQVHHPNCCRTEEHQGETRGRKRP